MKITEFGEYRGIEQIEVNGIVKDHILILYKGNDRLYIPTDQMNLIQKYIGKDGYKPKLNRLGSAEWTKTKVEQKKALDDIALDLVQLYARRDKLQGFSFQKIPLGKKNLRTVLYMRKLIHNLELLKK